MAFAIVGVPYMFLICAPATPLAFILPIRLACENCICGLNWPLLGVSLDIDCARDLDGVEGGKGRGEVVSSNGPVDDAPALLYRSRLV
ncbi:MAG: hypothetical protein J3R72DRAFT_433086 [Linnemannia gamsii]|nr:MAG: hypothetical protein J3R72DRAFT_433086 [Linnemannia gamsii]